MKLAYTVFSIDEIKAPRTVEIDGVPTEVEAPALEIQLTSDNYGSISLRVPAALAKNHGLVVGEACTVTVGGAK